MKSLNHFRSWHAAKEHPAKSLVKDQFQCSCNLPQHDLPFPRSKLCRPRRLDMYWIDLYGVFCSSLELAGCFLNNWKARLLPTNHASDNSGLDAETRTVGYWHFSFSSNLFYTGMCIETQDAISCWTNIRRLSRQHSCEAAHQHRFFQQLFNIAWSIILVQCYPHHVEAERQSLFWHNCFFRNNDLVGFFNFVPWKRNRLVDMEIGYIAWLVAEI